MLEHLKMSTLRTGLNSFLTSELAWFKSVSILDPEIEKQEARTAKLSIYWLSFDIGNLKVSNEGIPVVKCREQL